MRHNKIIVKTGVERKCLKPTFITKMNNMSSGGLFLMPIISLYEKSPPYQSDISIEKMIQSIVYNAAVNTKYAMHNVHIADTNRKHKQTFNSHI